MITKIHYQDDHPELMKALGGQMTSVIETGGGVKSAASAAIPRAVVEAHLPDKDHFLIHAVAMGDQECFGPNRNGDGWPAEGLMRKAGTFVTHGHYFEEHRNRDPKAARGVVKYAAYDPDTHRVELLIWGNIKRASEDYEAARSGKPLSFSMSARVPFDTCNCCGHDAKSPKHYCTHLKSSMNKYLPEFRKYAFAINPDPTFFDISKVRNPADRIAHYIEYRFPDGEAVKAASADNLVVPGHAWAEYEGVQDGGARAFTPRQRALLTKLARVEAEVEEAIASGRELSFWKNASHCWGARTRTMPSLPDSATMPDVLEKLAARAVLLPADVFASLCGPEFSLGPVSNLFRMLDGGNADGLDVVEPRDCGCGAGDGVQEFLDAAAENFSAAPSTAVRRITITITVNPEGVKMASTPASELDGIERAYALYKLAAIETATRYGHDENSLIAHACLQNFLHR